MFTMFGSIKEVMKGYLSLFMRFADNNTRHSSESCFLKKKNNQYKIVREEEE